MLFTQLLTKSNDNTSKAKDEFHAKNLAESSLICNGASICHTYRVSLIIIIIIIISTFINSARVTQWRWLATAVIFRPSDMSLGFAETWTVIAPATAETLEGVITVSVQLAFFGSVCISRWTVVCLGQKQYVKIYTVFQKNVTTFSKVSWSRTVRLQRFLAHLLPRVQAINRYY